MLRLHPRASWLYASPVGGPREAIWTDLMFGGSPPAPVQIPYSWLSPPVLMRPDKPFTTATVSQSGGGVVAHQVDTVSRDYFGEREFRATLDTACTADPGVLADYALSVYATQPGDSPRTRAVSLRLRLNARTSTEQWRILGVTLGRRVSITGAPTTWPPGATEHIVEGITHAVREDAGARDVEWRTSPLIGFEPGESGPWFRPNDSFVDGADVVPF